MSSWSKPSQVDRPHTAFYNAAAMPQPTFPAPDPSTAAIQREMRGHIRAMFDHALAECNVARAFGRKITVEGRYLRIGNDLYALESFSRALVISIGKAGHTMAEALIDILGAELNGIVASPTAPSAKAPGFQYFIGGHPLPNADSLRAGHAILQMLENLSPQTLVLFLISGGASAIAEKPIHPNISLGDVVATYKALVHSGAPIAEINAVRKHLSAMKGGRLARAAMPAQQVSVLVSDVPENALDALASGPTMPDTTTVDACHAIADRYELLPRFPASVRALFDSRALEETPKAGDIAFQHSRYNVVLSNMTAVRAAAEQAALAGFAVEIDSSCDDWDYQRAADYLLSRLRDLRRGVSRACLISGGEVTVTVGADAGSGGRNQQFALDCAEKISGEAITILSAGTDGIDGNSAAAGAVVDGATIERARQQNLDAHAALSRFDSFPLFDAIGDTIMTGPTGNNVRDLRILLAY